MKHYNDISPEEFRRVAGAVDEAAPTPNAEPIAVPAVHRPSIITAAELLSKDFPEPQYAVDGLLPEGLTILAGKPKLGKSWMALGVAIAVASGGRALGVLPVTQGDVLYLALEDGDRRLQSRLRIVLRHGGVPKNLEFATDWRRFDDGGLDDLEAWLREHANARLVIVDTLKRVRAPGNRGNRLYDDDYDAVGSLADLAKDYGVAIVVVHHTRKQGSEDPLEMVSGSNGLTGAVDGILVLTRSRGKTDAELFATGRDFEDVELALKWDALTCQWVSVGDAEDYRLSKERQEVVDVISTAGIPMRPKEISDTLGHSDSGNVRKILHSMTKDGQVRANPDGTYSVLVGGNISNAGNGNNEPFQLTASNATPVTVVTTVTDCDKPNGSRKVEFDEEALPF